MEQASGAVDGVLVIQRLSYDVRHALRRLRRRPLLTVVAVSVLALGVGPLTVLFSLINAVLCRPWQVPHPESVAVIRARPAGREVYGSISIAEYRYLREHSTTIAQMVASITASASVSNGAGYERSVQLAYVNADYFQAIGIGMTAGRGFVISDEDYNAPSPVAIISERLWRNTFGRDQSLIGHELRIAGVAYRVIGVAERGFVGVERPGPFGTDLWMPLPAQALGGQGPPNLVRFADPRGYALRILAGRLNVGVTREAAAAELSVLSARFRAAASLPSNGIEAIDTSPLSQAPPGSLLSVIPVYAPLLLAGLLVLLLVCANVGSLLLAETLSRERDIAIRLSLGSSRARVIGQLLMETALLLVAAAPLGLGLAFIVPRAMPLLGVTFGLAGFERVTGIIDRSRWLPSFYAPDGLVGSVAVVLASVTTALAVLVPAWRVGRLDLASVAGARHGRTAGRARLRFGLLAVQVAVAMVLLVGAATLTRATAHATSLNPGFTMEDVQVVTLQVGPSVRAEPARMKAFYLGLMDALETEDLGPLAFSDLAPFPDINLVMMARRPDEAPSVSRPIPLRPVSRNYFAVLNIAVVRGRAPAADTDSHEIVVNETAARVLWPGANPIGQTVLSAVSRTEFETLQVVAVVKDTPVRSMSEIGPVIYRSASWKMSASYLLVRNPSTALVDRVRTTAASLESDVTMTARPFSDFVFDSMATAVFAGRVAWGIGMLGLILAMVGTFGVFSQEVAERRYEIGVRRAVGASARDVAWLVMRSARQSIVWGLGAGFGLSLLAVPVLEHFLYGISPLDPIAYAQVGGILTIATVVATWVPIRRAVSVDPASVLRGN